MGCLSSWSCLSVVTSASSCCLPFLSWKSISRGTGQSDSLEPELLQRVWLFRRNSWNLFWIACELLFLELKHAALFFFLKKVSVPEWLQYGVTWSSSGMGNLGLSWMCSLVMVAGTGLPQSLGFMSGLTNGEQSCVQTDLMQAMEAEGGLYISVPYI